MIVGGLHGITIDMVLFVGIAVGRLFHDGRF